MDVHTSPLRGQALLDFLDRAERFWQNGFNDAPAGDKVHVPAAERRAALLEDMRVQAFAPATRDELERLYQLWLDLDAPRQANALIHAHLETVLSALPDPQQRARERLYFNLCEARSRHLFDLDGARARLPAILAELQDYIRTMTRRRPSQEVCQDICQHWSLLGNTALLSQSREVMEASYDGLRAFEREYLDTEADSPAFKDALAWLEKAKYALKWHEPEALDRAIHAAIAAMQAAPTVQPWDQLYAWLMHLKLSPAHIPWAVAAGEAHTAQVETPPASPAIRARRKVEAARTLAHAWAAQEEWDKALECARSGHFLLVGEPWNSDAFGAQMLDWMVKAGRMQEAAELAWHGFWSAPWNGMAQSAYRLARDMRDQDAFRPHWDWILGAAQLQNGLLKPFRDGERGLLQHLKPPPLPAEAYLERARTIAPDHPMHDLIAGSVLAQEQEWSAALPLLERGVFALPEYAKPVVQQQLWCARLKCLPEDEALSRPFPEASCGGQWCYLVGSALLWENEGFIHEVCADELTPSTQERRKALGLGYLELAIAHSEAFFASGKGTYTDGNEGCHALACYSVGYFYRKQGRLDEALARQYAGRASFPMQQQAREIFGCLIDKDDHKALIAFAEQHWHEVQQAGYQDGDRPYNPAHYIDHLALALHYEQRHLEISIWIDRVNTWWEYRKHADEEVRTHSCRGDYLSALMALLRCYALEAADKAEPLLRAHLVEVEALDEAHAGIKWLSFILFSAACAMQNCGHLADAIGLYKKAQHAAPEGYWVIADAHKNIAVCEKALKKPFWKFW